MVIGAFPVAKLGALLLKQVSKPIANAVKSQAKSSPVFRKYVCMPPAQFYNWCEIKTKMWILNLGKPVNIPVLNEAMAIELGANLLGEGIIFIIAAGVLLSEYNRSINKEAAKEEAKKREVIQIQQTMQELYFTIEKQGTQIRELSRIVTNLETSVVHKPWVPKNEPMDSTKTDDSPPPPPPPITSTDPILTLEELETDTFTLDKDFLSEKDQIKPSLLIAAINEVENDFLKSDSNSREIGIITQALNHIFKDVYRLSLVL